MLDRDPRGKPRNDNLRLAAGLSSNIKDYSCPEISQLSSRHSRFGNENIAPDRKRTRPMDAG
jgi:hypothetical protein